MITEQQFKDYIDRMSESYEKIKDIAQAGDHFLSPSVQDMLGELANFRDIACTALREAYTSKNFYDN